ncbi:MAG: MAG4270 family putative restriction endonuclease [Metamycoplasmataceae bacterium]
MKNCYLIKIPFATKGAIKHVDNSLKINGYANYVYDYENLQVIHEYLELENANYRMTDNNMIKPTAYYLKPKTKAFRDNFLDPITNHNPRNISDKLSKYNNLSEKQIILINNYLKTESTTIREQFSYLSGSNISGAKTNSKASPLVSMERGYVDCNFANPMKELKGKQTKNYNINKTITLTDLINNNKDFKTIFENYNIWYFNDKEIDISNYLNDLKINDFYDKNDFKNWVYPKNLEQKIDYYVNAHLNGLIKNNDLNAHKRTLRNFFCSGVKKGLDNKTIPFSATKEKIPSTVIENAHIINFAKLVDINTEKSILDAISPYNVLRIDALHHKLFDHNQITFDTNGNVLNKDGQKLKDFLDIDKLPKQTINFIRENYEYWDDYKINK